VVAMTDMMVDVETTGTASGSAAIIQLSAVKFNYTTGEVGGLFDRCPMPLPKRHWDDSTRDFWSGRNRDLYSAIVARAEPAAKVFFDFTAFALLDAPQGGYRFWSKPLCFDWPMVADHYLQLDAPMPFHYRLARDVNTWIAALRGRPEHPNMEAVVPFVGDKHNGLHDCAYQIDMLLHAKAGNFAEILPPE
jgi:hypothetical protein